jgi:hypothetical protein
MAKRKSPGFPGLNTFSKGFFGTLVLHPPIGIGHDGKHIDPEKDCSAVPMEGLTQLVEKFKRKHGFHNQTGSCKRVLAGGRDPVRSPF